MPPERGRDVFSAPNLFTNLFYENLPYYLSVGMTWDEYWNDDCTKTRYYRKADRLRKKQRNQELWLQGLYIYEAIGDMAPILHFSMDKKPKKPTPYTEEPYPLDEKEVKERKVRKEKEQAEKIKRKMMAYAVMVNAEMKEKEAVKDERSTDG